MSSSHPVRRSRPLLALALLAVLAGCGRAGDDAGTAAPAFPPDLVASDEPAAPTADDEPAPAELPDACALLPRADAEKLAGTPLDDPIAVRETCTYTAPVSGPTAQVEVYVGDGAKKMLDVDRELGHELTPLTGAGDEGYLEDGNAFFARSGVWVSIRLVRLNDPAENRGPLTAAARAAAGRM
ncbi:DUF3558 domain-containing protein [Plantactinospora sp. KBS50]|uniref:DUF3558 domain-containing protein n=1 Tax=Plantactinospora sp. KBS50 TaxID=2024580 RepID=UPI000BAB181A|nr:DUF3558 domain-containing protein [Plantactinospora sp. KBS50]ASW55938.1 hypothetical protein CIK06_19790 [Plantactinospora sp. KBS50]